MLLLLDGLDLDAVHEVIDKAVAELLLLPVRRARRALPGCNGLPILAQSFLPACRAVLLLLLEEKIHAERRTRHQRPPGF